MRRVLVAVLALMVFVSSVRPAQAFAPPTYTSNVGNLLGGVIEARAAATGQSVLSAATKTAIGTVLTGAAEAVAVPTAVGTPIGWAAVLGTLLVGAGVTGAVSLASKSSYQWYFGQGGKVRTSVPSSSGSESSALPTFGNFRGGVPGGTPIYCSHPIACFDAYYSTAGGFTQSELDAMHFVSAPTIDGWFNNTARVGPYYGTPNIAYTGPTPPPVAQCGYGSCGVQVSALCANPDGTTYKLSYSAMYSATGYNLNGHVATIGTSGFLDTPPDYDKGDDFKTTPAAPPEVDLGTAGMEIPPTVSGMEVDPDFLAKSLNEAWQKAAAQPGYSGMPYDSMNPITGDEVAEEAAKTGGMPKVSDLVSPVADGAESVQGVAPGISTYNGAVALGSASASTSTGTDTGSGIGTGTGSETTPKTSSLTCGLPGTPPCEVDWGSTAGAPSDPTVPALASVLGPLFNLFPSLKSWVAPPHSVSCPAPSFTVFGQDVSFRPVCNLLGSYTNTIGNAAIVGATFLSVIILLAA